MTVSEGNRCNHHKGKMEEKQPESVQINQERPTLVPLVGQQIFIKCQEQNANRTGVFLALMLPTTVRLQLPA